MSQIYISTIVNFLNELSLKAKYYLHIRRNKTIRDLLKQELPEILRVVARVYRVWPDLKMAFTKATRTITDSRLKIEFEMLLSHIQDGASIEEVLMKAAKRYKS